MGTGGHRAGSSPKQLEGSPASSLNKHYDLPEHSLPLTRGAPPASCLHPTSSRQGERGHWPETEGQCPPLPRTLSPHPVTPAAQHCWRDRANWDGKRLQSGHHAKHLPPSLSVLPATSCSRTAITPISNEETEAGCIRAPKTRQGGDMSPMCQSPDSLPALRGGDECETALTTRICLPCVCPPCL